MSYLVTNSIDIPTLKENLTYDLTNANSEETLSFYPGRLD